jgi:hypothetical protein
MTKTVLLARPHPFIMAVMKPFLEKCGFAPPSTRPCLAATLPPDAGRKWPHRRRRSTLPQPLASECVCRE